VAGAVDTCTINWDGSAAGGSWGTAGNWDLDRVPGPTDVVCIGQGTFPNVTGTVTYNTGVTLIEELRSTAPLSIIGGELALTNTTVTTNTVGGFSLGQSGQWGDLNEPQGSLTDTGSFAWTAGNIEAPLTQTNEPTLTVSSTTLAGSIDNPNLLDHWNLQFAGNLQVGQSDFSMANGGAIDVAGNVAFDGGVTINDSTSSGPFSVGASGSLTNTAGTTVLKVPVDVAGTTDVASGGLSVGADSVTGSIAGFDVATGATLSINNVKITGGSNSGGGTLYLFGTVADAAPLQVSNVSLQSGTTTLNDAIDCASLTISSGELNVAASGGLVGSLDMTGGQIGDTTNP
jgi:hypothetical protein